MYIINLKKTLHMCHFFVLSESITLTNNNITNNYKSLI